MNLDGLNETLFWSRVAKTDDCWTWNGKRTPDGYGTVRIYGKEPLWTTAHRISFVLNGGEIPAGYHVDHLCRNPPCVNPDHLEAVTPRENWERSNNPGAIASRRLHCLKGHPLSGENLAPRSDGPGRKCRACHREAAKRSRIKRGARS